MRWHVAGTQEQGNEKPALGLPVPAKAIIIAPSTSGIDAAPWQEYAADAVQSAAPHLSTACLDTHTAPSSAVSSVWPPPPSPPG